MAATRVGGVRPQARSDPCRRGPLNTRRGRIGLRARGHSCGVGATGATGAAAQGSALRIGLAEDPDILDPTLARTYVGRIVFASICDKLFDIDAKLNVVPQLALGHETSADGKEVTIRLRPGVKFHNGADFTAEDVAYSLERVPMVQSPSSFSVYTRDIADVQVVDVDLADDRRLMLQHRTRPGQLLAPRDAEATLRYVAGLWGYEVRLQEIDVDTGTVLATHTANPPAS